MVPRLAFFFFFSSKPAVALTIGVAHHPGCKSTRREDESLPFLSVCPIPIHSLRHDHISQDRMVVSSMFIAKGFLLHFNCAGTAMKMHTHKRCRCRVFGSQRRSFTCTKICIRYLTQGIESQLQTCCRARSVRAGVRIPPCGVDGDKTTKSSIGLSGVTREEGSNYFSIHSGGEFMPATRVCLLCNGELASVELCSLS